MQSLEVKAFGFELSAERNLFHLTLTALADFPRHLPLHSPNFTLFLAWDSRSVPVEVLAGFAEKALAQGTVYICAWGPDCERVHDIFDEAIVEQQLRSNSEEYISSDVMTTWHSDETLEDALEFFLTAAEPDDKFTDRCNAALVVSIDNPSWADVVDKVMLSQVPAEARTYIYSGGSNGRGWMRDDFEEPLEEFAEYI